MPWNLFISTIPILSLLVALLIYELRANRRRKQRAKELKECVLPLVDAVQKKHKAKYGRISQALEREFHTQH